MLSVTVNDLLRRCSDVKNFKICHSVMCKFTPDSFEIDRISVFSFLNDFYFNISLS